MFPVVTAEASQESAGVHAPCTYIVLQPPPRPSRHGRVSKTAVHCSAQQPVAEGPQRPLNLPNTKKLKYFNILWFFFLVPEFIPWVLGSHCVLYIYIYIMCIYILYFFWLGLFLIQSYTMVASPNLKGCHILMLENELGGKASVSGKSLGLREMALSHRGNRDGKMGRKTNSLQEVWVYKPSGPGVFGPQGKAGLGWETPGLPSPVTWC